MNPVAFSTLACPGWTIQNIIARAAEYGFDGIEWRGGPHGHVYPAMPPAQKMALRAGCAEAGLGLLAVTAYTSFISGSAAEQRANVYELQRYTDLAAELGAQYVRTFLGELPAGMYPNDRMYSSMADSLSVASEYAVSVGVRIAIEPHDDFTRLPAIIPVFEQTQTLPNLDVIWDFGNAIAAGAHFTEGFDFLKDHLAYVQVKDGKGHGAEWQLCALGKGDVPLGEIFEQLVRIDYQGTFSVEWEYAWHPELEPPEVALPAALRVVRNLLAEAKLRSTTN